ncbi:hypothetical protein GCM10009856_29750 [Mycolicibacterium llatzerense]
MGSFPDREFVVTFPATGQPITNPPAATPPATSPAVPTPTDPPAPTPPPDRGFPENTPIADMTAEQRSEYWKFHDRKKSDLLKAYNGITPEQAAALQARNEELERAQMSAADQALATARDEATVAANTAAAAQWAPQLMESIVGQFVDEEARPAVMAGLNPMSFVKDGKFDKDALVGHLTGLAAAFGGGVTPPAGAGTQQQEQPRQWGQSGERPPARSASDEGLAEAKRRGYIKD